MYIPKDTSIYGYLSEHHSFGEVAKKAGEYAEDLAATIFARLKKTIRTDYGRLFLQQLFFWKVRKIHE